MIASFRHRGLERYFERNDPTGVRAEWRQRVVALLDALDAAEAPEDMRGAVGFHRLKGRPTRWAVTVSRNWRLTFAWDGSNAIDIDLEDYHGR